MQRLEEELCSARVFAGEQAVDDYGKLGWHVRAEFDEWRNRGVQVDGVEFVEGLRLAVGSQALPANWTEREVILLTHFSELSYGEVAGILNIPEGTVAVEVGSPVLGVDGAHLGRVEEVVVDANTERMTHIVIERGLVSKERRLIPTEWVEVLTEREVRLAVAAEAVDQLPLYEP